MIPDKATRDEWRTLAENTQLTSELGEYTPEEFTILLDAVDELDDTVARLRQALAVHQDAKELNDFETAGDVEAKSTRILRSLIALVPIAYECDNVTSIRRCPSAAFPLCSVCDEPTGRCGEDSMWSADGEPLCDECNKTHGEDAESSS